MCSPTVMHSFHFLEEWLLPALISKEKIDYIEVGKEDGRGTEITAMFKTRLHGTIGFSFHVVNINNKWSARAKPEFLSMMNDNK